MLGGEGREDVALGLGEQGEEAVGVVALEHLLGGGGVVRVGGARGRGGARVGVGARVVVAEGRGEVGG